MTRNRMYHELAWLWPLLSPPESYAFEAQLWREALFTKLGPGRHELLELGVGGGHNLSYLTDDFRATAVDLSPEMLAVSRRLNPDVVHVCGDMRSVRMAKRFDAVLVHDAIDYMLSEDDLRATFETARAHLRPGGVFITAPDYFRETFEDPTHWSVSRANDEVELTYLGYEYDPDPTDTTKEAIFVYLIREDDTVRVEEDRHTTGLFPLQRWIDLLTEAGFAIELHPYPVHDDDREAYLFVATVPESL